MITIIYYIFWDGSEPLDSDGSTSGWGELLVGQGAHAGSQDRRTHMRLNHHDAPLEKFNSLIKAFENLTDGRANTFT